MSRFNNKLALVTGAGSGIGEAIAKRLVRDGARVVVSDLSGRQDQVAERLGPNAIARHLDVSSAESVNDMEAYLRTEFGGLDILANNAGILAGNALTHAFPIEAFDKVMSVNVRGAYLVLQAGLRLMLESGGGSVVNTASVGGFRATPMSSAYIISKGAVVMMTRAAALEYADKGIRVNAIAPGATRTAITDTIEANVLEMLVSQIPQGRLGTADEIANIATFLADDNEASHVTGQVWTIDGGRSAG